MKTYLYFDKEGKCKEIVQEPIRVGSNTDQIFAYYENDNPTILSAWCRYFLPNGEYYEYGGSADIPYNQPKTRTYIEYKEKRDLKFFKYLKDYDFYRWDIPSGVLENDGGIGIEITFIGTPDSGGEIAPIYPMGFVPLYVEGNVIKQESLITLSQWEILKTLISKWQDLIVNKQDRLIEGENITIENNVISATDTTYNAGNGLSLDNGTFSVDTDVIQKKLRVGSNVSIEDNLISAVDTKYTAGNGINISPDNVISATGGSWGSITGDIDNQTDLKNALDNKVNTSTLTSNYRTSAQQDIIDNNIRAVAEGKTQTFVSGYNWKFSDFNLYFAKFYLPNGTEITELIGTSTYIDDNCVNNIFNSQDNAVQFPFSNDKYVILRSEDPTAAPYTASQHLIVASINTIQVALHRGDIILIVETDVPDRWFDFVGTDKNFYKLETSKVDLNNYYTKNESNDRFVLKSNMAITDADFDEIYGD